MKKIVLWVFCALVQVVHANATNYDQQYLQWKSNQLPVAGTLQSKNDTKPVVHQTGKISINQADIHVLQQLHGVGEKKAQAIIQHRQENGPFQQIEELKKVVGIGEKTFEKNKDILVL